MIKLHYDDRLTPQHVLHYALDKILPSLELSVHHLWEWMCEYYDYEDIPRYCAVLGDRLSSPVMLDVSTMRKDPSGSVVFTQSDTIMGVLRHKDLTLTPNAQSQSGIHQLIPELVGATNLLMFYKSTTGWMCAFHFHREDVNQAMRVFCYALSWPSSKPMDIDIFMSLLPERIKDAIYD